MTPNSFTTTDPNSGNDSGWLSDILNSGANLARALAPIWAGDAGQTNAQTPQPTQATTATPVVGTYALAQYMPYILIGGAVLAVIILVKK